MGISMGHRIKDQEPTYTPEYDPRPQRTIRKHNERQEYARRTRQALIQRADNQIWPYRIAWIVIVGAFVVGYKYTYPDASIGQWIGTARPMNTVGGLLIFAGMYQWLRYKLIDEPEMKRRGAQWLAVLLCVAGVLAAMSGGN